MVFLALFDIYSREPDFLAENEIFKHYLTTEPRTGFFSQESDLKKILKCLNACLVGVF